MISGDVMGFSAAGSGARPIPGPTTPASPAAGCVRAAGGAVDDVDGPPEDEADLGVGVEEVARPAEGAGRGTLVADMSRV